MKKFLAATTAAVICTVAVPYANAQDAESHEGRHHMRGAGHRMNHDEFGAPDRLVKMMTRHLDLNETQSQAIGNILVAAKPEFDILRQRAEESRSALQALDVDDPHYGSNLQNLSTQFGALTAAAALLHAPLRADVHAQLQGVGSHHGAHAAVAQASLDLTAFGRQVAAAVALHERRRHVRPHQRLSHVFEHHLDVQPTTRKDDRGHAADNQL